MCDEHWLCRTGAGVYGPRVSGERSDVWPSSVHRLRRRGCSRQGCGRHSVPVFRRRNVPCRFVRVRVRDRHSKSERPAVLRASLKCRAEVGSHLRNPRGGRRGRLRRGRRARRAVLAGGRGGGGDLRAAARVRAAARRVGAPLLSALRIDVGVCANRALLGLRVLGGSRRHRARRAVRLERGVLGACALHAGAAGDDVRAVLRRRLALSRRARVRPRMVLAALHADGGDRVRRSLV